MKLQQIFLSVLLAKLELNKEPAFIQTRVQSGNLFMQYNYTDTSNPTEDKYRGFNYRTGVTSGVEKQTISISITIRNSS